MPIVLLDADSMLYAACLNKKDEPPTTLEDAKGKFDSFYNNVCVAIEEQGNNIEQVKLYISGKNNYRKFIYPQYKANRPPKPELLPELYEWVFDNYNEIPNTKVYYAHGCEADDMIYAAWNYLTQVYDVNSVVIASIDKDLKQIPCWFFDYYYTRMSLSFISKKEALHNFYTQMITGDSTDGVNFTKGIGIKFAENLLASCDSEFSYQRRVYEFYQKRFKNKARRMYELTYQLLRLNKNVELPDIEF